MISKNQELIGRIKSKLRSGDFDVQKVASLMQEYFEAITAHNRGLMNLEEVLKHEKALWDFVEE